MAGAALFLALGRFKPIISEGRKMISPPAGGCWKTRACNFQAEERRAGSAFRPFAECHFHCSCPFIFPERKLSGQALPAQHRLRRPEHRGCPPEQAPPALP